MRVKDIRYAHIGLSTNSGEDRLPGRVLVGPVVQPDHRYFRAQKVRLQPDRELPGRSGGVIDLERCDPGVILVAHPVSN